MSYFYVKFPDLKNTTKACQLQKKALLINHLFISVIQTHYTYMCVCVYFSKFRNPFFSFINEKVKNGSAVSQTLMFPSEYK